MSNSDVGAAFENLIADLKLNASRSPWAKEQGLSGWIGHLVDEVNEVRQAFESGDMEHVAEEMGDVLWDWVALSLAIEAEGGPSVTEIAQNVSKKFRRRKPWIFDGGPLPESATEERQKYLKSKAEES